MQKKKKEQHQQTATQHTATEQCATKDTETVVKQATELNTRQWKQWRNATNKKLEQHTHMQPWQRNESSE